TNQEVTAIVSENFLTSKATASMMCQQVGAQIFPVDIGIVRDTKLLNKKVSYGTKNIKKGPAMTKEEVYQGIETGISMVSKLKEEGYHIIATGEMGIGNTTTSSAIASVLLEVDPEVVTGVGAGLSKEGVQKKIEVIRQAIAVNHPDKNDPIEVLRTLGGLDIAGLTGVFLGGAIYRVPIVIDGMISGIAALLAASIHPLSTSFQLASHLSKEPAAGMILSKLGKEPYITCGFSLGEGTGALSLFPLLDLALCVYNGMATFEENHIEQYRSFDE
ncbi:MAG TPA: nicotinate-nucleotide--dimethylbenzimidazole phosphoribosyltransferase, partial [Candidatus Merdenecus merdavium]|nr:nicotinate-nucleotide--dimethylbenzimidazole phosphoribosyltransferase [Candidatus Merdenecus merdavium]